MSVAMLNLPLTSVVLASVFLASGNAVRLMPLVIVAVVVSYVGSAWLRPPTATSSRANEG